MATKYSTVTSVQPVTITQAPKINDQQFQGWYIHPDGSLEAIDCPASSSLFTTSNYAVCCGIGATTCSTFWTRCAGTIAVGVSSNDCGSTSFCQTMSIYDRSPTNGNLVHSQIICAPTNWAAFQIYRTVLNTTSSTVISTITYTSAFTSTFTSMTAPTQASVVNTASSAVTNVGLTSQTSDPNSGSPNSNNNNNQSMAWIAGVVIGPIVLIALLVLLIWAIRRGKFKKIPTSEKEAAAHSANVASPPAYAYTPYQETQHKYEAGMQQQAYPQELHNQSRPQEMDAAMQRGPYEMPESGGWSNPQHQYPK